jgi:hypothetical protein
VIFTELEAEGKEEGGKQPRRWKFRRVEGAMGERLVVGLFGFKVERGGIGGAEMLEEWVDVEVEVEYRVDEDAG